MKTNQKTQLSIIQSVASSSKEAYIRLLKAAYQMSLQPTMPFKHFKVLVACMRENGVRLIKDMDNHKAARALVKAIGQAVKEKVSTIIQASNFISVLSDGSQARKTGSDKELILTRTALNGKPVFLVTSLADMSSYGGMTTYYF